MFARASVAITTCEMPQQFNFSVRTYLDSRAWLNILIAVTSVVAVGIASVVVAIGVFVILVPVMAVTAVAYYFSPNARFGSARHRGTMGNSES